MNNYWNTTVKELITIFRGAMQSIIPWLDKAKIKWKEGESYDDWDKISITIYENIVCTSLYSEVADSYPMSKYLYSYDDYSFMDYIEVRSKNNTGKRFAFVAFYSNFSPLDCVKVAELDKTNKVVGHINLKFEDLEFVFVKNIDGKKKVLDSIQVVL